TLFTITNTSRYPQIANVTLWTDWAYPVLAFNIFLTGYDVQGINLYDVIVRGLVVPTGINPLPGEPRPTGSTAGATPVSNTANPNFILDDSPRDVRKSCNGLPGFLPRDLVLAVSNALTAGTGYVAPTTSCGTTQ